MHRFLALNAPTWRDLEHSFGTPTLHPFSLLDGRHRLGACYRNPPEPDHSRLARTLGLDRARWEMATLRWRRRTVADDTWPSMRFCPICVQAGYHCVAFQFAFLDQCPIHDAPLVAACPVCDAPISADLNPRAVQSPFACSSCGRPFAPLSSLISPPALDTRVLLKILRWYRDLRDRLVAVSDHAIDASAGPLGAPSWRHACLEAMGCPSGGAAQGHAIRALCARCGIRLTPHEAARRVDEHDEARRRRQIYKAYRRHVQKGLPYGSQGMMNRLVAGVAEREACVRTGDPLEARTGVVGLLLFRAVLEDWPDPFIVNLPALCRALARHPFKTDGAAAPRFSTASCPPGSATGRWLQDHLYGQWLQSQFEARLAQARERVQSGHYRLWPLRTEGWRILWAVGVLTARGLEFRAWRPTEGAQNLYLKKYESLP